MNLHALQSAFQDYVIALNGGIAMQIRSLPGATASQRLEIYAEAYRLRLAEVLAYHFPALAKYLGESEFDELAVKFIDGNPSRRFSVRWFGDRLEDFLRTTPPYRDRPELAELAAFEWALEGAFDAADTVPVRREDLTALPATCWPALHFTFQPALQTLNLSRNAVEIWQTTGSGRTPPPVALAGPAQHWLIWRQGFNCKFRPLSETEANTLNAARSARPFAELCELIDREAGDAGAAAEAASLLQRWVADELITGIETGTTQ